MAAAVFPHPERSSRRELFFISLPADVILNIASFLQAFDVCSLGSCCRLLRDLCLSDVLWMHLSKKRWPSSHFPIPQGWKGLYISEHKSMAASASYVLKFVEECSRNGSLEVGDYLKAVEGVHSAGLEFGDVRQFLLVEKHGVLMNLIGVHYSILWLRIPLSDVIKALRSCQVADRAVRVTWSKFGRWFYGFRLPDERRSCEVTIAKLVAEEGEEIRSVLIRGAVHEVLRVQITPVTSPDPS